MMFITKHMCRLAIVLTILASDIILGSRALGQTRGRLDAKTITLGIVSEINQKEIVEHFQPFVRYVASRLSSASPIDPRPWVSQGLARQATEGGFLHGESPSDVFDQQRLRIREITPEALERGHGRLPRHNFHKEKR